MLRGVTPHLVLENTMFEDFDPDVAAAPTYEVWKSSALLFHKIRPFVTNTDLDLIARDRTEGFGLISDVFEQVPAEILDTRSVHLMSFANSVDAIFLLSDRDEDQIRRARLVPIYSTESLAACKAGGQQYPEAPRSCMLAYHNFPVPLDTRLVWGQVVEFRKDKWSVHRYRRFRTWIQELLLHPLTLSSTEILHHRIDEYERSLMKHGIETARGSVEVAFEPAKLIAATLAAGASRASLQDSIAALAGGMRIGAEAWVCLVDSAADPARTYEDEAVREVSIAYHVETNMECEKRRI